ncbi:MAG: Tetratricopeptide repeat-containing protein [Pelagibacterales bacterium]|nr:Tetratricopeptide repeat-containing protein [Pelagibacterales bacterium]
MKKNIKYLFLLFILLSFSFNFNAVQAAGSTDSGDDNKASLYKAGKKFVYRAKKLEKKNKKEKAQELYLKAYTKFEQAYSNDKKDADILNYLGYTLRKTGNLKKAEIFYLKGLELDAGHLGINEYLGELYVQTNRIGLAKKRLTVLKGCSCKEYDDLKELIENK